MLSYNTRDLDSVKKGHLVVNLRVLFCMFIYFASLKSVSRDGGVTGLGTDLIVLAP